MTEPATEGKKTRTPSQGNFCFLQRLEREGRREKYTDALREGYKTCQTIGQRGSIQKEVRKQFGYLGAAREVKLQTKWELEHGPIEIPDRPNPKEFDGVLASLPQSADTGLENEWILSHPALSRKMRGQTDAKGNVIITADDLTKAKHGKCPSAAAANKLQYWANKPEKVFENLAVIMKKSDGAESVKDSEYIPDPNLDDVRRMLKDAGRP
jgi:hypothetical protein